MTICCCTLQTLLKLFHAIYLFCTVLLRDSQCLVMLSITKGKKKEYSTSPDD